MCKELLDEFIDCLLSDHQGQILVINFLHGLEWGVMSEQIARGFVKRWFDPFIIDKQEVIFKSILTKYESTIKTLDLEREDVLQATLIKRETSNENIGFFYTVKEWSIFYPYILGGYCPNDTLPDPDMLGFSDRLVDCAAYGALSKIVDIPEDNYLSLYNSVLWVSTEEVFEQVKKEPSECPATQIRDLLGLASVSEKTDLVALEIASEYFKSKTDDFLPVRPTPFDAAIHPRFKCLSPAELNAETLNEMGYTFNLNHLNNTTIHSDGAPEFVVRERNISKVDKVRVLYLGKTDSPVMLDEENNKNFAMYLNDLGVEKLSLSNTKQKLLDLYLNEL